MSYSTLVIPLVRNGSTGVAAGYTDDVDQGAPVTFTAGALHRSVATQHHCVQFGTGFGQSTIFRSVQAFSLPAEAMGGVGRRRNFLR